MRKSDGTKKELVASLRKSGMSLRDIHKETGVARSTISLWARNVELTEEEQDGLRETKRLGSVRAAKTLNLQKKLRHEKYLDAGKQLAIKHELDPKFSAGCFLYWGEGSKYQSVHFCNTDPDAVLFHVRWLTKYFDVENRRFVARLIYHTNGVFSESEVKEFWEQKLSPLHFEWVGVKCIPGKESKKGKCPYGIFSIRFDSTEINDTILGAVRHIAEFDRTEWSFKCTRSSLSEAKTPVCESGELGRHQL